MHRAILLGALSAGTCALVGCHDAAPAAVSVDAVSYTEDQLLGISPSRRATLARLTALGLAVADSTTDELGAPLVRQWTEERRLEILAAELTLEKNGVGDDVLEARYLTNPQWELTVRHILFFSERWRSPAERTAAREKADRALKLLEGGADFPETAARLSEEPGAEGRQGLLTPGREGSWVPEFWAAALALQPGEISPVTETQYGYHILRLEKREIVPFAEARSGVAREVASQLGDPEGVLSDWIAAQPGEDGRALALAEAGRRGLTVPAAERTELARKWDDQVYQWSATLGLTYGLGPAQVAAAALRALSLPGQNADIARNELAEHDDLFRARYEITVADDGG